MTLAGVRSLTLYDRTPTTIADLSTQFYLGMADIGQPRAQASSRRVAELNPYVPVSVLDGELNEAAVQRFQVRLSFFFGSRFRC